MSVSDFAIPALVLTLGLVEIFIEKEKYPILKKSLIIGVSIFTFGFSFWAASQNSDASDALKSSNDSLLVKSDALKKKLETLSAENDSIQKNFQDSLNSHYVNEVKEIQFTAYKMSKIFAENSNKNISEHIRTQSLVGKIDTSKLKPADIELLPEPHNVFKFYCDSAQITFDLVLTNLGDRVAYKLDCDFYVIIKIQDRFYQFGKNVSHLSSPTFPPGINRTMSTISTYKNKSNLLFCPLIDEIYCFAIGTYYLDDKLKDKKTFKFGLYKLKSDETPSLWNDNDSIDKFLNNASPIPF